MSEGGIGDIHSNARGTAARYNAGKPDLALIPLTVVALAFERSDAQRALFCLGRWQETGKIQWLYDALEVLGVEGWAECADVFTYGKAKYAAWNWAKGFTWSVPLACAARHLVFGMLQGEDIDAESGKPHRGHVFCNIVMLLTFHKTFTEGDDRPRVLAPESEQFMRDHEFLMGQPVRYNVLP